MSSTATLRLPDERRLAFAQYGDFNGVPILHCHGAPGSAREITSGIAGAAREAGVHLLLPNRPGYRDSDFHDGASLLGWAQDVAALLDALAVERCHVIGYSAGGPYALAVARALPGRVVGVALCGSLAPGLLDAAVESRLRPELAQTCRTARDAPDALRQMLASMAQVPELLLQMFSAAMPEVDRVMWGDAAFRAGYLAVCADALQCGGAGMIRDYALIAADWGFALEDIAAPVGIWHGDLDANVAPFLAERLAAGLRNNRLHRVTDAGHLLFFSHWRKLVDDLLSR